MCISQEVMSSIAGFFLASSMVLATLLVVFVALLFRLSGTESDFQLTHHQVCLSIAVKGDMALGPGK